jgi:hypothetical protein
MPKESSPVAAVVRKEGRVSHSGHVHVPLHSTYWEGSQMAQESHRFHSVYLSAVQTGPCVVHPSV